MVRVASGVPAVGLFAESSQIEYLSSLTQSTLNTSLASRTERPKKAGRVDALPALLCDYYIDLSFREIQFPAQRFYCDRPNSQQGQG